jgi:hypothetical protein
MFRVASIYRSDRERILGSSSGARVRRPAADVGVEAWRSVISPVEIAEFEKLLWITVTITVVGVDRPVSTGVVFIATCLLWRRSNGFVVAVVRTKEVTVYAERGQEVEAGWSNGFDGNLVTKQ